MDYQQEKDFIHDLSGIPAHWEPIMFYVDVNWKSKEEDKYMIEMLDKYFEAYTFGRELSSVGKVPHY